MELEEIKNLLDKYLTGNATTEEKKLVENWYENLHYEELSLEGQRLSDLQYDMRSSLLSLIRKPRHIYLRWAVAAAAIVILVSVGIMFYNVNLKQQQGKDRIIATVNDISPGGNNAILTLADGSRIILNNAKEGKLDKEGSILKKRDGLITYRRTGGKKENDVVVYNSIVTPMGGQYTVVLEDGTKVWLNAASSLKFPTNFTGKQRRVELSGEAYFEVKKNVDMPFIVTCKKQTIEVLGTHFNINGYTEEEKITTTLLEGRVKVHSMGEVVLLKPGEQSTAFARAASGKKPGISVAEVNTEEAVAWKNGWFFFTNADIRIVMGQISRWYDVDVIYQGKIPEDHFRGKVSRNVKISQILKILEASGVNFKIEGKTIIVK